MEKQKKKEESSDAACYHGWRMQAEARSASFDVH